jgi:hypothetical protein
MRSFNRNNGSTVSERTSPLEMFFMWQRKEILEMRCEERVEVEKSEIKSQPLQLILDTITTPNRETKLC